MKSLTLAVRSLREDSRAPIQWVMRSALVATFLIMVVTQHQSRSIVGAAGRDLFESLVWTNFWFMLVIGSALFSSVITEEKEQGTLGLLKLAGFGAPSILLGKSIGELTSAALLLGVQLPFAMLTVTLGGVSAHQVLAAFVLLAAFTVAVFGLSLLSSVVCQRTASAARLTLLLVGLMAFGGALFTPIVLRFAPSAAASAPAWLIALHGLSPFGGLAGIVATGFGDPLPTPAMLACVGVALVAMLLAASWFPRATGRDLPIAPPRARWSWLAGRSHSRPSPGAHAVGWREFHFTGLGRFGMALRMATAMVVLIGSAHLNPASRAASFAETCARALPLMLLLFVLDAGSLAGRLFRDEIRGNTLLGLSTLPIPLNGWAGAKALAAVRLAMPTLAGFLLAAGSSLAAFPHRPLIRHVVELFYCTGLALTVVHLTAYLSLRLRRGALALSLAAAVVFQLLLNTWVFRNLDVNSVFVCLGFLGLLMIVASIGLQAAILRRLRALVAGHD